MCLHFKELPAFDAMVCFECMLFQTYECLHMGLAPASIRYRPYGRWMRVRDPEEWGFDADKRVPPLRDNEEAITRMYGEWLVNKVILGDICTLPTERLLGTSD